MRQIEPEDWLTKVKPNTLNPAPGQQTVENMKALLCVLPEALLDHITKVGKSCPLFRRQHSKNHPPDAARIVTRITAMKGPEIILQPRLKFLLRAVFLTPEVQLKLSNHPSPPFC